METQSLSQIAHIISGCRCLGEPQDFAAGSEHGHGWTLFRGYSVVFASKTLEIMIYEMPDGKMEEYLVGAGN
jgi:hypothetical protein